VLSRMAHHRDQRPRCWIHVRLAQLINRWDLALLLKNDDIPPCSCEGGRRGCGRRVIGKRRTVDCISTRLHAVPTGSPELREGSWQIVDRRVAVADEEHAGTGSSVRTVAAARL